MILTTEQYEAEAEDVAPGELTDSMARTVASWWHSPSRVDAPITALSHGLPFRSTELVESIDATLAWAEKQGQNPPEDLDQLRALRKWANELWILSVWSSYGHTFMHDDDGVSCLTCGARYHVEHDDPDDYRHGRYLTWNGDDPTECTGDTSMSHGQDDMHAIDAHPDGGTCAHCDHDCNCLVCTG